MRTFSHKSRSALCPSGCGKCQSCKWERKLAKEGLGHLDSEDDAGHVYVSNRGAGKLATRAAAEDREEAKEVLEHRLTILAQHKFDTAFDKHVWQLYANGYGSPAIADLLKIAQKGFPPWRVRSAIERVQRQWEQRKTKPMTHGDLAKLLLQCEPTMVRLLFQVMRGACDNPDKASKLLDAAEDNPQIRAILDPPPPYDYEAEEHDE